MKRTAAAPSASVCAGATSGCDFLAIDLDRDSQRHVGRGLALVADLDLRLDHVAGAVARPSNSSFFSSLSGVYLLTSNFRGRASFAGRAPSGDSVT